MKRTLLSSLCIAVAAAVAVPAVAGAAAPTHSGSKRNIAEVLLADSRYDNADGFDRYAFDFDIVTQAILLFPDLVAAASDPSSQLTLFLPTDSAFRSLVQSLTGQYVRSEEEVFNAVAGLGTDVVLAVLTYHVVPGAVIDYRAATQADGAALTTLNGASITIAVKGWFVKFIQLQDNDPDLRDPFVILPNIRASNGIIHGIDRVLLPIDV